MTDAEAVKKAVAQGPKETTKAIVLAMTDANEGSRIPTTGMRQVSYAEVTRSRMAGLSLGASIQLGSQIQVYRFKNTSK